MSEGRFGWTVLFALAWRQRRGGPGRVVLAVAGPVLAVLGFALADTIATSAALVTQHDLAGLPPGAYDLLARPRGTVTAVERALRLVAPDELRWGSGITIAQWQGIAHLPGVEVAAPVAPAGTLEVAAPARTPCCSPVPTVARPRRPTVLDITVAGIDPTAETRLVRLDRARAFGALLPAAIPPREWLTPPFLLVGTRAGDPPGRHVGRHEATPRTGEGDLLRLLTTGTVGGGLLPPAVDRYAFAGPRTPGTTPVLAGADAAELPSLPRTATAWLSIGSPGGAIRGAIDPARLSLGALRLDPLPFALYGRGRASTSNSPSLLTDVRAVCRLLGDGCISAVRVRVVAPAGINSRRAAVVATVARAIEHRTGLWVDVTYGAAGRPIHVVDRGAGTNGGAEDWLVEGATLAISRGVNAINLLLFGLIGAIAVLSTVAGAMVAALQRAPERAILRQSGWSAGALRRLTLADTMLVSGVAGLLALLALGCMLLAGLSVPLPALWAVLPLAAAAYALGAALGDALARFDHAATPRRRWAGTSRFAPWWSPLSRLLWWLLLALRNARRRPVRAVLGIMTAAIAAAVCTVLLLGVTTLHGLLSVTLLGRGIAVEVAPYHVALAAIAVVLTLITLGDLAVQGVRERRVEIGTLRAVGFSARAVLRLVAVESGLTAAAGSLLGVAATTCAVVWGYGPALDGALIPPAVAASFGVALALCVVSTAPPAAHATAITPAEAQRGG